MNYWKDFFDGLYDKYGEVPMRILIPLIVGGGILFFLLIFFLLSLS